MIHKLDTSDSPWPFEVRVLRQDSPHSSSYWQRFRLAHEPDMNVISVLQHIAADPVTVSGRRVAPVAWACGCLEEVCGACTMLINGRVRQACSAMVRHLIEPEGGPLELRPMTKFPVVRDLAVDRDRLFLALKKVHAWLPVDGYHALGSGPLQSQEDQEWAYPLSQCMSCGCCLEACPQYGKVDPRQGKNESDEDFERRKQTAFEGAFIGAHAISQTVLFNTHPTGKMRPAERLEALMSAGGIQQCGNAQNCVAVCPKEIPLTRSIAKAGRDTTLYTMRKWFDK